MESATDSTFEPKPPGEQQPQSAEPPPPAASDKLGSLSLEAPASESAATTTTTIGTAASEKPAVSTNGIVANYDTETLLTTMMNTANEQPRSPGLSEENLSSATRSTAPEAPKDLASESTNGSENGQQGAAMVSLVGNGDQHLQNAGKAVQKSNLMSEDTTTNPPPTAIESERQSQQVDDLLAPPTATSRPDLLQPTEMKQDIGLDQNPNAVCPATENGPPPASEKQQQLEKQVQLLEAQLREAQENNSQLTSERNNLQSQNVKLEQQLENVRKQHSQTFTNLQTANDRIQILESQLQTSNTQNKDLTSQLQNLTTQNTKLHSQLSTLRTERDDHQRHRHSLATRLQTLLHHQDAHSTQLHDLTDALDATRTQLATTQHDYQTLSNTHAATTAQLVHAQTIATQATAFTTTALDRARNQRRIRATRMRQYIHGKTEQVRQAQTDVEALQVELGQMAANLRQVTEQREELHGQWKLTQARNRELQRDVQKWRQQQQQRGNSSSSSTVNSTTAEQQQRQAAARQELVHLLQQWEGGVERLRDRVQQMVPTVREQQTAVRRGVEQLQEAVPQLELRLGANVLAEDDNEEADESQMTNGYTSSIATGSGLEGGPYAGISRVLERWEHESQNLGATLATLTRAVAQVRQLADRPLRNNNNTGAHHRTCVTVLTELVRTGSLANSPALQVPQRLLTAQAGRGSYGQVPATEEGTAAASSSP